MVESYASSEELGFIALTLREGGYIWLAAASIYAVEKNPQESFSMVKTMGEVIGVTEEPHVVFDRVKEIQANNEERFRLAAEERERESVREFVDWTEKWKVPVQIQKHEPVKVFESDERAIEYTRRREEAQILQRLASDGDGAADDADADDEITVAVPDAVWISRSEAQHVVDDRQMLRLFSAVGEGVEQPSAFVVQSLNAMSRDRMSASLARLVDDGALLKTQVDGKARWALSPSGESVLDVLNEIAERLEADGAGS